ncbi:stalk domain-containing protein [Paenibacillus sp. YYML68]|uniref:stalk domain-containing protein n=1 Tax=Paenibacillus sp. YYML68 TaxID=2909250 RepID=UPI0024911998|nr:stalk domain-containing protein [Paenibacillus sp. YYML68]
MRSMRKRKRKLTGMRRAAILTVILLSCSTAAVWAAGGLQTIQVMFERVHIAVNGQQASLSKDSILYNGSIFVPLRSLGEMLGAEVSWDNLKRTINLDFIGAQSDELKQSSELGMYQYVAITNTYILQDLIQAMKKTDTAAMGEIRDRYAVLEQTVRDVGDEELAKSFAKMSAAVELLRGGWASKSFEDYSIAWTIFNTNAEKVNAVLKAKLDAAAASTSTGG